VPQPGVLSQERSWRAKKRDDCVRPERKGKVAAVETVDSCKILSVLSGDGEKRHSMV
jgi:hypothetical protein